MKKRIPLFLLATVLSLGLSFGSLALAQPPMHGEHFPAKHITSPDRRGPYGEHFKGPEGHRPDKEMRDNFRHDKKDLKDRAHQRKKDFQERQHRDKKEFNDRMRHDKKFDRPDHKDFRPGEHNGRPDFGKYGHDGRPGEHRGIPDFGQHRN